MSPGLWGYVRLRRDHHGEYNRAGVQQQEELKFLQKDNCDWIRATLGPVSRFPLHDFIPDGDSARNTNAQGSAHN